MTNIVAYTLVALLAAFLLVDWLWLGWDVPLFIGKELDRFIEYIAFWR